jgi:hypothetical protein
MRGRILEVEKAEVENMGIGYNNGKNRVKPQGFKVIPGIALRGK